MCVPMRYPMSVDKLTNRKTREVAYSECHLI